MKNNWKDLDAKNYPTPWDGWFFENGLLWDDQGNHYTPKDVKHSWQAEKIITEKFGTSSNIRILKDHLKNVIKGE